MKTPIVIVGLLAVVAGLSQVQRATGEEHSSSARVSSDVSAPRVSVRLTMVEVSPSRIRNHGFVFPGPNGKIFTEAIQGPGRGQRVEFGTCSEAQRFVRTMEAKGMLRVRQDPCLVVDLGRQAQFVTGGLYSTTVRTDGGKMVPLNRPYGSLATVLVTMSNQDTIRLAIRVESSTLWRPDSKAAGPESPQITGWLIDTICDVRPNQTLILNGFRPLNDSDILSSLTGDDATQPSADRPLCRPSHEDSKIVMLVTAHLVER